MFVHKVLSNVIAGFGYENNVLRILIKSKDGKTCAAYDYRNVSEEDVGYFAHNLGKALNYIKNKYHGEPVTGIKYSL